MQDFQRALRAEQGIEHAQIRNGDRIDQSLALPVTQLDQADLRVKSIDADELGIESEGLGLQPARQGRLQTLRAVEVKRF